MHTADFTHMNCEFCLASHMSWHCWHKWAASVAGIHLRPFWLIAQKYWSMALRVHFSKERMSEATTLDFDTVTNIKQHKRNSNTTNQNYHSHNHPHSTCMTSMLQGHIGRFALMVDHILKPAAHSSRVISFSTKFGWIWQPLAVEGHSHNMHTHTHIQQIPLIKQDTTYMHAKFVLCTIQVRCTFECTQ